MVSCVRELVLQGIAVKIPDLAIFSIGIKNKEGAAFEKEFSITKNIAGLKLRARGTGEFKATSLNLDASLKKATAVTGDVTPTRRRQGQHRRYHPGWRHKPGWRLNTDWRIRQHREQRLRW